MRIASTIGATGLQHEGVDYEPDEDGMFEVPEPVGEALVRFPHWQREHEAVEQAAAVEHASDVDPEVLAARVAEQGAEIEALRAELAAAKAAPARSAPAKRTVTKAARRK